MSKEDNVEIEVRNEKVGLSMKAKGAGIIILLSISIGGIVLLGYLASTSGQAASGFTILPMMFLLYITYNLIAVAGTMFTDKDWEFDPDK